MSRELTTEQQGIKKDFQDLVTSDQKFTPELAALAYALSQEFTSAGGFNENFHATSVIDGLLYGETPDHTTASLEIAEFGLNTRGFNKDIGTLIEDLSEEDQKKAEKFLQETDKAVNKLFTTR